MKDTKMHHVLWVSRHPMTDGQMADLERVMGGPVELLCWKDTVRDVCQLEPLLAQAEAAAVVLPPELLSRLMPLAAGKPVLQAVSGREPTGRMIRRPDGREEAEFAFVHKGWQQILRMELETRMV